MQIVIDIDEETLQDLYDSRYVSPHIKDVFRSATPFPKGHGRLVDADALEQEIISGIKAGNYEEGYEKFQHINDIDDCVECVKYSDTIIETDKEGKHEITD